MSRLELAQHVHQDHAFGLEARGHARDAPFEQLLRDRVQRCRSCEDFLEQAPHGLDRVAIAGGRARRARQPIRGRELLHVLARAGSTACAIMPAPAVALVAGSMTMKLPVTRLS